MAVNDGDLVRVKANIDLPDLVLAQNVYVWYLTDPVPDNPSNAQIEIALDTKITDMYTDLQGSLDTGLTVDNIDIERVDWISGKWETVENLNSREINVTGGDATGMVPHGVAAVVTMETARPQTRARKFLPGLVEGQVDDSSCGGTLLAALSAYATEWLTDLLVTGSAYLLPMVLGQSGVSAGISYLLTNAIINEIVGYQRRRKPGVGV